MMICYRGYLRTQAFVNTPYFTYSANNVSVITKLCVMPYYEFSLPNLPRLSVKRDNRFIIINISIFIKLSKERD